MKKRLLLCVATMAAFSMTAVAQTEESPQELVVGSNKMNEGTAWYTFKATATGMLKLNGVKFSTYADKVTAKSATGESWDVHFYSGWSVEYSAFYVEKDVDYTFSWMARYDSNFVVEFTPVEGSITGADCSDAMLMPENGQLLFPNYSDGSSMDVPYTYATFTAPFDGKLHLEFVNRPESLEVASDCSGEWTNCSQRYDSDRGIYMYSIPLSTDEKALVRVGGNMLMMADVSFNEVVIGASCEEPFTATEGENVLPAAAGVYFYRVECPQTLSKYTMTVSSAAAGCTVIVTDDCYSYQPKVYESLNFEESPVLAGSIRIIKVEKAEDTATDESFTIKFSEMSPVYDSAVGLTIGFNEDVTTPGTTATSPGIFYYNFTAPEGEPQLLEVTSNAAPGGLFNGPFSLTEEGTSYPAYSRVDNLRCQTKPGMKYILTVNVPEGNPEGYTFRLSLTEMERGMTSTYPIVTGLGDIDVPAFSPAYFSYTPEHDHYLVIRSEAQVRVYEPGMWGGTSEVSLVAMEDGGLRFESKAGTTYTIVVTGGEGTVLKLEESAYGAGETASTAIEVEAGDYEVAAAPSKIWYKLTSPMTGFFTVSTTLNTYYNNKVSIYRGEVSEATRTNLEIKYDAYSTKWGEYKEGVASGEVMYVCIENVMGDAATVSFGFSTASAGQIASKPLPLDFKAPESTLTFKAATPTAPVWYSIDLPAGMFNITSEMEIELQLYSTDNTMTPIARGGWLSSTSYGLSKAYIEKPGTYLIKLTINYEDALEVKAFVTEPAPGDIPATAIAIAPETLPYELALPTIESGSNAVWYRMDLYSGDLNIAGGEGQYYSARLFSADDMTTPVAETQYQMGETSYSYSYGISEFKVAAEGTYYLQVIMAYSGTVLEFSGSAFEKKVDTGVDTVSSAVAIEAVGGKVKVSNAPEGARILVYSLSGIFMGEYRAQTDGVEIELPQGAYVIAVDGATAKVLL